MKYVVVTGGREWRNVSLIQETLTTVQHRWPEEDIVLRQGCASGADAIARSVGLFFGWRVEDYWPDFMDGGGFTASVLRRNIAMLDAYPTPDLVVAFPTQSSRGTWHTVREADKRNIETLIVSGEVHPKEGKQ